MTPSRFGLAAVAALALLPVPVRVAGQQAAATTQEVRGAVTEGGTLAPIEGAMVLLIDASGRRVGGVLSGVNGRFRVSAPIPGRYQLRIDRIGYGTTNTEAFDIPAGSSVEHDVVSTVQAIQLAGIDVTGSSRNCAVRPAEGLATATLWEEARKALEAATWTSERGIYDFTWTTFDRVLDQYARVVVSDTRSTRRAYSTSPFVAADPDTLASKGFVQVLAGGDWQYWAPDAPVLLSDPFLDTHCFRLQQRERDGVVELGLAFEPISKRRIADVQGVLWIDRATARLRSLVYTYTDLPRAEFSGAGGKATFVELPNGTWVVQDWSILMPVATELGDVRRTISYSYRVQGGMVRRAVTSSGEIAFDNVGAGIQGTVVDTLGAPAPNARVRIKGTQLSATTDANGAFTLPGVGEGTWILYAAPDLLELAGIEAPGVEAVVGSTGMTTVRVELPSVAKTLGRVCEKPPRPQESVVIGRVIDSGGDAVKGAGIRLDFDDIAMENGVIRRTHRQGTASSDAAGAFHFCGILRGQNVTARASLGDRSGEVVLRVSDPTHVLVLPLLSAP